MNANIKRNLSNDGWSMIYNIFSKRDLFDFAQKLGTVIPHPNGELINTLKANDGKYASRGSFSYQFGFYSFPLHTDTAFWPKPARYMMLGSINANKYDTLIFNSRDFISTLNKEELNTAMKAVFVVKTFHGQHYTSLIFKDGKIMGFRFDPCCMVPINHAAKRIVIIYHEFFEKIEPKRIKWNGKSAAILDNWIMLHGRTEVDRNSERELNRIYIEAI